MCWTQASSGLVVVGKQQVGIMFGAKKREREVCQQVLKWRWDRIRRQRGVNSGGQCDNGTMEGEWKRK